jgi:hypothetical protein
MSSGPYDPSYPSHEPQQPGEGQGWGQPQGYQAPPPYGAQPAQWNQPYGGQPYGQPYTASPGYGYPPVPPQQPSNGMGIAGFVTGLVGLILCWVPWLGLLLSIVGVALSGAGISQGKKKGASTGLAIAGLSCGAVGLILSIVILVFIYAAASSYRTF